MTSTEKGAVQSTKCRIEWKIERFFADCEEVGDSYTSPVFTIPYAKKITAWTLKVYPKGQEEKDKDYLAIFLKFNSSDVSAVIVDYQVSIVSEQNACPVNLTRSLIKASEGLLKGYGWPNFTHHDFIKDEKNGCINNDTLTILCEITFLREAEAVAVKSKEYNNLLDKIDKGLKNYDKLFECNDFSDVTFTIQNQKLYLHKAILSCRNSYFKDMFENEIEEERPRKKLKVANDVKITNASYEVMKEVFRFIYTGKVQNIEKSAKDLLIAADKYSVIDLKALCEMTLAKTLDTDLTIDTATDYLKLVNICETSHLKTSIIEFAVKNGKEIITKPEFQNVDKSVIIQIMQEMVKKS